MFLVLFVFFFSACAIQPFLQKEFSYILNETILQHLLLVCTHTHILEGEEEVNARKTDRLSERHIVDRQTGSRID